MGARSKWCFVGAVKNAPWRSTSWDLPVRRASLSVMGYFDSDENVEEYLSLAEGYDGAKLVAELRDRSTGGARVLELGMGPGKDLDLLLAAGFDATGSDSSEVFLRRYRDGGGKAAVLNLDARTIDTDQRFDVIYSNKVLQHLTRDEMRASLARQVEVVEPGGLLFHALWYGDGQDEHHDLLFTKYTRESLGSVMGDKLEAIEFVRYEEMSADDSFWVLLRRQS